MVDSFWKFYTLINYCGQRATGSFFAQRAVINVIMFEFSFVTSGVPFALMKMFEVRDPAIGAVVAFGYVIILWRILEAKVKRNIDFEFCERYYLSLTKVRKLLSFVTTILLLILTFLFMFLSIKVIF
jgi:hypothetical protein